MTTLLQNLLDPFLSLLYPPCCLLCRTLGPANLCDRCATQITPVPEPHCKRCGHSVAGKTGCSNCFARLRTFTHTRAMGTYDGVLREAIHRFKYRDRPQLAEPLGILLAEYARSQASDLNGLCFDGLLPVPMHPVRQRLRGYNQSERLVRVLSRELGIPQVKNLLLRHRSTRPQVGLEREARQTNLQDAFAVPHPDVVAGKTLLLVDDVSTTGSTLHESSLALKAAGAKAIYCLTLAAG